MKKEKIFDDILKLSGGVFKSLDGAKEYSKEKIKRKLTKSLENLDFVKKNDFELVKAMCVKLSKENVKLARKVNLLEKKIIKSK